MRIKNIILVVVAIVLTLTQLGCRPTPLPSPAPQTSRLNRAEKEVVRLRREVGRLRASLKRRKASDKKLWGRFVLLQNDHMGLKKTSKFWEDLALGLDETAREWRVRLEKQDKALGKCLKTPARLVSSKVRPLTYGEEKRAQAGWLRPLLRGAHRYLVEAHPLGPHHDAAYEKFLKHLPE